MSRRVTMTNDTLMRAIKGAVERESIALLERINAAAEADMLRGSPIVGALQSGDGGRTG